MCWLPCDDVRRSRLRTARVALSTGMSSVAFGRQRETPARPHQRRQSGAYARVSAKEPFRCGCDAHHLRRVFRVKRFHLAPVPVGCRLADRGTARPTHPMLYPPTVDTVGSSRQSNAERAQTAAQLQPCADSRARSSPTAGLDVTHEGHPTEPHRDALRATEERAN